MIVLYLGGARSGKSRLAEQRATATAEPVTYVATAVVGDEDFARRVAEHRARRPPTWHTIESGTDLADRLRGVDGTALIDSLGTWVAGHHDFHVDLPPLIAALATRDGDTLVVSEEVGLGVHPATAVGRAFRDTLGTVNQSVAEIAHEVLLVVAGRALRLEARR